MVPEQHPDWKRVQKLVHEFFEGVIEAEEDDGPTAVDDMCIVAMIVDQNGDEAARIQSSAKRAVTQVGLLRLGQLSVEYRFVNEEEDD